MSARQYARRIRDSVHNQQMFTWKRIGLRRLAAPILFCLLGLMLSALRASALPEFLDIAKQTFAIKAGGTIDKAGCKLCHASAGPPDLNPYGTSVRSALKQAHLKTPTANLLHQLDSQDSDGDGFPNSAEFAADTLPGDPTSHPAGPPPAASGTQNAPAPAEASPFDIKAALLEKHAQHPILVHLPIGLFVGGLLFDLLAFWKKKPALAVAGFYNTVMAAVTSVFTIITGLLAWQWQFNGAALTGNLRLHLILGIVSSVLLFALWGVRVKQQKPGEEKMVSVSYLALALITLLVISLTGHLGGFLSGVNTG